MAEGSTQGSTEPAAQPHGSGYAEIAEHYAAVVDQKPHNALYERPATLSLLPPLAGLDVLDVGCGSGWYAEHYLAQGASVTSFDLMPRFVELTRARVGGRVTVLQADLAQPLAFAADAAFDLAVAPLVLHYLKDWVPSLRELARVLRPGGRLVFSTHHPFMDWQEFQLADYFATTLIEDTWDVGKVTFYHRPLTDMVAGLAAAGFVVEALLEPRPSEAFGQALPDWYKRMAKSPWFLHFRARRDG